MSLDRRVIPRTIDEVDTPPVDRDCAQWPSLTQLVESDALSPAARGFIRAAMQKPNLPERLAKMALVFRDKDQRRDARRLARAARDLAAGDYRIQVLTEWLDRREAPLWHFGIVHDEPRNAIFAQALKRFLEPGMTVFEIGTGTGILAMLAIQAGAQHVYSCERRSDVAKAARAIVERNGMGDRITVIAKDAHDVRVGSDLPERADLFVAEIVDDTLLGEQVLPLTEMARARLLKPQAILLPRQISAMGYLVSGRGHSARYRMTSAMGFDLSPFNRFTPTVISAGMGGGEVEPLSEPARLIGFDLAQDGPKEGRYPLRLRVNRPGTAEAVMRWLQLDFGAGIVYENRPPLRSAWRPQLHILPEPRDVNTGDAVEIEVYHNRNRLFLIP